MDIFLDVWRPSVESLWFPTATWRLATLATTTDTTASVATPRGLESKSTTLSFTSPQSTTSSVGQTSDSVNRHTTTDVSYDIDLTAIAGGQASTVAYAAHCQQEVEFDRPIAGHMNICPKSIVNGTKEIEGLESTVKHELLHALGFSMSLFAFFR